MYLFIYAIKREGCSLSLYLGIKRLKVGCWLSSLCNFCYVLCSMTPYLYISLSFHIFISHKKGRMQWMQPFPDLYPTTSISSEYREKVVGKKETLQLDKGRLLALWNICYVHWSISFYLYNFLHLKKEKVSINATLSRFICHHLYNYPMSHLPAFVCVSQNTKRRWLDPPCHLYATCAVQSNIYNVYIFYYMCCIRKLLLLLRETFIKKVQFF